MASKGISAIMRGTSLSKADPFVKMSVTAVLSGMASKASGGDFVQGAMSAMVVWLYNDNFSYSDIKFRKLPSKEVMRQRKAVYYMKRRLAAIRAGRLSSSSTYSYRDAYGRVLRDEIREQKTLKALKITAKYGVLVVTTYNAIGLTYKVSRIGYYLLMRNPGIGLGVTGWAVKSGQYFPKTVDSVSSKYDDLKEWYENR